MNRISEIKERFKKRTKGEWRCIDLTSTYKIETKNHVIIAIAYSKTNATFIAYAPEDINYLVAKNEKLKEKLAFENKCYIACSSTLAGMTKDWKDAKDKCEQLKKENMDMLCATQDAMHSLENTIKENTKLQRVYDCAEALNERYTKDKVADINEPRCAELWKGLRQALKDKDTK